jgi:hypothetical protein
MLTRILLTEPQSIKNIKNIYNATRVLYKLTKTEKVSPEKIVKLEMLPTHQEYPSIVNPNPCPWNKDFLDSMDSLVNISNIFEDDEINIDEYEDNNKVSPIPDFDLFVESKSVSRIVSGEIYITTGPYYKEVYWCDYSHQGFEDTFIVADADFFDTYGFPKDTINQDTYESIPGYYYECMENVFSLNGKTLNDLRNDFKKCKSGIKFTESAALFIYLKNNNFC